MVGPALAGPFAFICLLDLFAFYLRGQIDFPPAKP
jgi:hypothetical protein